MTVTKPLPYRMGGLSCRLITKLELGSDNSIASAKREKYLANLTVLKISLEHVYLTLTFFPRIVKLH